MSASLDDNFARTPISQEKGKKQMSQRPKAVETECAGCGVGLTWPDDGSLPACSFLCERALFGETAAAKEWPLEAAYVMCTEGRKHLEIAEATRLDVSVVVQISAAQQNGSTLGDVLRFLSEATGETTASGPEDVQFGDHDVMRNDGSPEAKTAKKMHTWLSGLTVKSIIPGSTPGWILIEFVPFFGEAEGACHSSPRRSSAYF